MTDKRTEEVGCWNCALEAAKSGKPVCLDCGTEVARYCKEYSHEKIWVHKSEEVSVYGDKL